VIKAFIPGGLRIGTPAMTSRGLLESDFEKVAEFIDRGVQIAIDVDDKVKGMEESFERRRATFINDHCTCLIIRQEVTRFQQLYWRRWVKRT